MMKVISEISKDFARAHDIDPDMINAKPNQIQNIFSDPRWLTIQTQLLTMIDPYPEIKEAIVTMLRRR